jgi:hypothetical protein
MIQVNDYLTIYASSLDIPSVRAFNFIADANTTSAQNATVLVDNELFV